MFNNETIAIICATILGCFSCIFPDKAIVALPIATGLIGYLKGKSDAIQIQQATPIHGSDSTQS